MMMKETIDVQLLQPQYRYPKSKVRHLRGDTSATTGRATRVLTATRATKATEKSVPSPTPTEQSVPEKPSLEQATGHDVPERNDTMSRFSVELSFAVVLVENTEDSGDGDANGTQYSNVLSTIVNALNAIIANDTDYEVHSANHNNNNMTNNNGEQVSGGNDTDEASAGLPVSDHKSSSSSSSSSWVYMLKLENATVKEQRDNNATACRVVDTNETIMVTWVKAVLHYFIHPERRATPPDTNDTTNHSAEQDVASGTTFTIRDVDADEHLVHESEDSYEDKSEKDNIFEGINPHQGTDMHRSSGGNHYWDWETVGSTVINATMQRIHDGGVLEWIQEENLSVVAVSPVGMENLTECMVVDMNPTLDVPIPFVDPLDLASWDALQMLGSIMFLLTLTATSSLCFIGRNRSKALHKEQWTARFGNEAAVNDFLDLSSQFLPPECINQRDANAAMLVTMPASPPPQPEMHDHHLVPKRQR